LDKNAFREVKRRHRIEAPSARGKQHKSPNQQRVQSLGRKGRNPAAHKEQIIKNAGRGKKTASKAKYTPAKKSPNEKKRQESLRYRRDTKEKSTTNGIITLEGGPDGAVGEGRDGHLESAKALRRQGAGPSASGGKKAVPQKEKT